MFCVSYISKALLKQSSTLSVLSIPLWSSLLLGISNLKSFLLTETHPVCDLALDRSACLSPTDYISPAEQRWSC